MHGHNGQLASLYEEVYARPDDDELRRVLADALLALGDPRGELIQMQLNPTLDYQRRAMRLLQQHGLAWTGSLRGVVIPLAYERGFLAACQVLDGTNDTVGALEWATVHTIELATRQIGFLSDPVMRSLRCVQKVRRDQLGEIGAIAQLRTMVTTGGETIERGGNGHWRYPAELADDD